MADFTINADGFGAFYQNVGNNGTDDRVTVNIGPNFAGSITVDSQPADGEIDDSIINLPPGWTLQVSNLVEDGAEDPSFKDWSYEVLDAQGNSVGTLSIRSNNIQGVPCFCADTLIETPDGPVPVQALVAGDLVLTRDHGPQVLRWTGGVRLSPLHLLRAPHLRPIRIRAGALGAGLPASDLLVSPQHRVLVRSSIARRMFDSAEVLVAAKQLLLLDGIDIADDLPEVRYLHLLFDRHEVVIANGAEAESLYAGPEALQSLGRAELDEIIALSATASAPSDAPHAPRQRPAPARMMPSGRKARKLALRHMQHQKPLVARAPA